MPIVVKHQAAGIAPSQENPRLKYGMMMTMQQQRADQEMRQRSQDAQYDMQRMGMMAQNQVPRQPSLGEESVMLDQEIRSGMYDPDTVKALRDDERAMRLIMRDRNIDATQRAQALENIQSRIRMARSTGRVQPMQQQMPQQVGPMALQTKPPMTEAEYFEDPVRYKDGRAAAMQQIEAANGVLNEDNIHAQMHNNYLAREKFLQNPGGSASPQGQPQPPAMGASPQPASATAPLTYVPQAMENERWGAREFGVENVLATPASPPIPGVATGASLPATMMGQQPQRSANMVYTAEDQERIRRMPPSAITPNFATGTKFETVPYLSQPAQQQQPMYPMEAIAGSRVDPGYAAPQDSGFASARTFTSADGRSMVGSIVGINPPSSNGGFSTVQIRKDSDGKVYDVPLNNLSQQDQQYVLSGGNRDTMYDLQNPSRSSGTDFMDPKNPVRQEMSAADQSIVNPQKQTLGSEYKGRYGLGGADYGINPATGNRVTASVRPGGTALEYDEPVGAPGTAMGGRKGSLNYLGGKRKVDQKKKAPVVGVDVSPNAVDELEAAKAVAGNPNATEAEQAKAMKVLANNGVTFEEAENLVKPTTTAKPATPVVTPVQPAKPQQTEPSNTFMGRNVGNFRPRGWGDVPPAATVPEQKPKPGPPRPSQAEIEEMLNYLKTGKPSDAERQIILDVLNSEGVSLDSTIKPSVPVGRSPTMAELEGGRGSTVNQESEAVSAARKAARTWTSADGKKTFDGSLVGFSYDSVDGRRVAVFNSTDGQVFKIPIENLSEDDQSRLLAASAIEKATDRQSSDYPKYGVKIGVGEKYIAPKTSSKSRPSKGRGRGTSTDPSSKWPEEVIRSIPETTARKAKRTS